MAKQDNGISLYKKYFLPCFLFFDVGENSNKVFFSYKNLLIIAKTIILMLFGSIIKYTRHV
ncbi:MAG: hypothetical protein IPL35_09945 [Sphingobacteriales bacterium]|nr:hypothetical protein [Sphingobacteriales bacterium]